MNKRIITSLLALMMALSMTASVYAADDVVEENADAAETEIIEEAEEAVSDDADEAEEAETEEEDAEKEEVEEGVIADDSAEETEAEPVSITLTIGVNSIFSNDEEKELDVAPCIINDRTMVPMRAIFEALGAVVSWDDETKTVFAVKGEDVIVMQIGQDKMFVNSESVELDSPSIIVDDRTMVPVRAIAEAFGNIVEYDAETQTVKITG